MAAGRLKKVGNLAIHLLLLAWAGGTAFAFWHFEGQYLRPVSRPARAAIAQPELLPTAPYRALTTEHGPISLVGPEPVTVLNFWNPHCPCSRYAESDVRRLIAQYGPIGVRFLTVVAAGPSSQDGQESLSAWQGRGIPSAAVVDNDNRIARRFGVWAAPAAVILTTRGRVAYTGAYNAARYCHDPRTAWGEKALAAVVQGRKPPRAKTPFFGCQLVGTTR
jgi:hypothetical protein